MRRIRRMLTRSALPVIAVALAGVAAEPAAAGGPKGLRFGPVVARLPAQDAISTSLDTVRRDASGGLLVTAHQRIGTFDAHGHLQAQWTVPGATQPYDHVTADVAADGTVYAAMTGTDIVHVYDRHGNEMARFGGPGVLAPIDQLALDPRGSLLVVDLGGANALPRLVRLGTDGTPFGLVPGGPLGRFLTVAPDGSRWVAGFTSVVGVGPDGRTSAVVGPTCDIRLEPQECARDTGRIEWATDLAVDGRGRLVVAEPGEADIQLFGRSGRLRLTCTGQHGGRSTQALDPEPGGLLVANGPAVRRATWTRKPTRNCIRGTMRLDRVRVRRVPRRGDAWRIGYRVSERARVSTHVSRVRPVPCPSSPANPYDPHEHCTQELSTYRGPTVKARRGSHTLRIRLPRGMWTVQLYAVSRRSQGDQTPPITLRSR